MRKLLLGLASAGLLFAMTPVVTPAQSQGTSVTVRTGGSGVGVRVGETRRRTVYTTRSRTVYRPAYRTRTTTVVRPSRSMAYAGCQAVTVKQRMPNGTTVIRKTRRC